MEKSKLINRKSVLQLVSFGFAVFLIRVGMDYFSNQPIEGAKIATEVVLTTIIYGLLTLLFDYFSRKKMKKGN